MTSRKRKAGRDPSPRARRAQHQPFTDVPPLWHTWFSVSQSVHTLKAYVTFTTSARDDVKQQISQGESVTSSFVDSFSSFVALCCAAFHRDHLSINLCMYSSDEFSFSVGGAVLFITAHILPLFIQNKLET